MESAERYIRRLQIELGRSIANRKKIYLDLRYWIIARSAALGVRTDPNASKLLHFLRRGVANGALICPIGAGTFSELMKQRFSEGRRIGTARLIDELSLGVSIIPTRIVTGTEIARSLHAAANFPTHDMQELVWTKVAFVLGDFIPSLPQLDGQTELELQTGFIDKMWAQTLTDIVLTIGEAWPRHEEFDRLAERITRESAKHADSLISFEATYRDEATGLADGFAATAAEIVAQLASRKGQVYRNHDWHVQTGICRNLLRSYLSKEDGKRSLKTMWASAVLHASLRWNKGQRFDANDFYDFDHAAVALSYCDVFLTEGPLRHMITARHVGFDKISECRVIADLEEAVEFLREASRPVIQTA
jgi:hypothetical protein